MRIQPSPYIGIAALALLASTAIGASAQSPGSAAGREVVVAQDGSGDVGTITDAVAMAQDGDSILVRPGTYLESITMAKDITVSGDGDRDDVIVEFTESSPVTSWCRASGGCGSPAPYGFILDDATVELRNLTVRGPAQASAIITDAGTPTLDGVVVDLGGIPHDIPRASVLIGTGSQATVRNSILEGWNEVGQNATALFETNEFSEACLTSWSNGAHVTVRGNTFSGCPWGWGIDTDPGSSWTIEGNAISNPGIALAIEAGPSDVILVEGNTIVDSQTGVQFDGGGDADVMLRGNTIGGNGVGLLVGAGASPALEGNTIHENRFGVVVGEGATPSMEGNALCDNGTDLATAVGSTLTFDGNETC